MKNGNSIFAVLAEALEKNKKLRTILYAVLIILALAIFLTSGLFGGGKDTNKSSGRTEEEQTGEFSNTEEARMLEARLEDILSQMQNAGQVRVMVTFDNAQEKVIAADEQKSSGSSGISEASRPVKTSGSGGESPIILTERMPKIRGVIVIAEGAADISVRFSLAAAVSTVLGIDENSVEVFVMMPVLFFLFAGLGVYIATLPGAGDGYRYIFTLDPVGLADPKLWIYAFGQAFFSLSVAGNGTVIYGSYFSDDESIPSAARHVALFDTLAALLAALVIIPAAGAGGAGRSDGGRGGRVICLGGVIGLVFFLCVLFAGLTSLVNLYEVSVEALQDKLHLKRVAAVAVIAVIGTAVSLCIQAIVSDWMDVVSTYICPLGALLAGILFFWVAGKDFVLAAVNKGVGKPIGAWFYPLSKYVYCACALLALIAGALLGGIG